jgi:hypothetical protein
VHSAEDQFEHDDFGQKDRDESECCRGQFVQITAPCGMGEAQLLQRAASSIGAAASSWRANSSSASNGSSAGAVAIARCTCGLAVGRDWAATAGARRAADAVVGAADREGLAEGLAAIVRVAPQPEQRARFPTAVAGALKLLPQSHVTFREST